MKITFKEIKSNSEYEPRDTHEILVNDKCMISVGEGMEPEDVQFCRDLVSPFAFEPIIKMVIEAVKKGETVDLEHITVEKD